MVLATFERADVAGCGEVRAVAGVWCQIQEERSVVLMVLTNELHCLLGQHICGDGGWGGQRRMAWRDVAAVLLDQRLCVHCPNCAPPSAHLCYSQTPGCHTPH